MKQHFTKFELKARYFQLGEINSETKKLIFVLHGYGQQAQYFIKKFEVLKNEHNCIVAPEGLNRFYLEGFSGRVGATWMTKEDRLTDIENYLTYLSKVYSEVTSNTPKDIEITIVGFSQGCATASRWASSGNVNFHRLILWAGIFPPDLNATLAGEVLKGKTVQYVYGTDDPYLSKERIHEMKQISKELKVQPEVLTFEGKHDIDEEILKRLF